MTSNVDFTTNLVPSFWGNRITISQKNNTITELFSYKTAWTGCLGWLFGLDDVGLKKAGYEVMVISNADSSGASTVYVKAELIAALDCVKQLQGASEANNNPDLTVRKIYDVYKKNKIENTIIENGEVLVGKIIKGGYSYTLIPERANKVTKFFTETNQIEISKNKVTSILKRVNPHNNAIGLQKCPTFYEEVSTITVYNPKLKKIVTIRAGKSIEKAYKSDLYRLRNKERLPIKEVPSMCACLVQGSKVLLENKIYHLDVKLENIGYLGEGRVEHFDLDGCADGSKKLKGSKYFWTPEVTSLEEIEKLNRDERRLRRFKSLDTIYKTNEEAEPILEKMHIFQLGVAIYEMVTNEYPYTLKEVGESKYPDKGIEKGILMAKLAGSLADFNYDQIKIIVKMVSLDPSKRPSIAEIEAVFPRGSIQGIATS